MVSWSSPESKYRAIACLICKLFWVKDPLSKLGFTLESFVRLYSDNQVVIHIVENLVFHKRIKYMRWIVMWCTRRVYKGESHLYSTWIINSLIGRYIHEASWKDLSWFYLWEARHVWCTCSNLRENVIRSRYIIRSHYKI